jgi:hypothetical protein
MVARVLPCLLLAGAVLASLPAGAEPRGESCELPAADVDPLTDRAGILAEYERLPHACLRALFTACTESANRNLLDFGTATVCSFGYEALLSQGFGGNFSALLAWWSSQRAQALQ